MIGTPASDIRSSARALARKCVGQEFPVDAISHVPNQCGRPHICAVVVPPRDDVKVEMINALTCFGSISVQYVDPRRTETGEHRCADFPHECHHRIEIKGIHI